MLPKQGAQVQWLLRELDPAGHAAKIEKKKKKKSRNSQIKKKRKKENYQINKNSMKKDESISIDHYLTVTDLL